MKISRWLKQLVSRTGRKSKQANFRAIPSLELLEDRLTPAVITDNGTSLFIDLSANEDLKVVSQGSEYIFTTDQLFINAGVDNPNDFSGFASSSLTLESSGLARYDTIIFEDGRDSLLTFRNSGLNSYSDDIIVDFDASDVQVDSSLSVLGDLRIKADAISINGNIGTLGSQFYDGPIELTTSIVMGSGGGGDITYDGTIDGNFTLLINTSGITRFNGSVGGRDAISRLETDAGGTTEFANGTPTVTATGIVELNDPVTLFSNATFTASRVNFNNTLDGDHDLSFDVTTSVSFGGDVGVNEALDLIQTTSTGTTNIATEEIRTTGILRLRNDVNFSNATTTLTANEIDFNAGADSVGSTANTRLTIKQIDPTRTITLGADVDTADQLDLRDNDLAAFDNTFQSITVGDNSHSLVTFLTATIPDSPLNARAREIDIDDVVTSTSTNVNLTARDRIRFNVDSGYSTVDGDLTVLTTGATSDTFQGIRVQNGVTVETTGTGNISLTGTGAQVIAPISDLYGVHINGVVQSTSTALDAGTITINGNGGIGQNRRHGVVITGEILSESGDIEITGENGGNGEGIVLSTGEIGGDASTANITLIADSIDLAGGEIDSDGILTIKPLGTFGPETIGLGGGSGGLNLTDDELTRLVDGFSSIVIGDDTNTLAVNVDTVSFSDPLTLIGQRVSDASGTDITMVNGDTVTLVGRISPVADDTVGILEVDGSIVIDATSTTYIEIDSPARLNSGGLIFDVIDPHDKIEATGTVTLGGDLTLDLSDLPADELNGGESFTILTSSGIIGEFANAPQGSVVATNVAGNPLLVLTIDYTAAGGNNVVLRATRTLDFGDAPDTGAGTGNGNYQTLESDGGPSHGVDSNLFIGANVDFENDASPSTQANGDGLDEDGLVIPQVDLTLTVGTSPVVNVNVHNTTGSNATLYGWIDFNGDGVFDNATERASMVINDGTIGTVALAFPTIPEGFTGTTYARFRLSTDAAAANPTGQASDGEVEDYLATITEPTDGTVASFVKIASGQNGSPTLNNNSLFGSAVVSLGDLNGDGINDLAVGRPRPNNNGQGSVEILFMNADGTVASSQNIGSGQGGTNPRFGISLANIGDLDGDGVTDLLVGAPHFFRLQSGNPNSVPVRGGRAVIVFLNEDGTVKRRQEVLAPERAANDNFGQSVASLGDLNGDGITDIAVGAFNRDTGGDNRGAVYVFFLNADGTFQSTTTIAHNTNGGPSLANGDQFGSSLAGIGDLDGDGITELAVGVQGDDFNRTTNPNRGSVYILFMNDDGTVKSNQTKKIEHNTNGGPSLSDGDLFGSSLAFVGDLDGDGINDLAAGAIRDDNPGSDRGSVYLLFMNTDGSAREVTRIGSGINGGPNLGNTHEFGSGIGLLGDLNNDGTPELGVGAWMDNTGGDNRGALYILSLNPFPTTTVSLDVSGNLLIEDTDGADTDDTITIQSDTTNSRFIITDPNNHLTTTIAGATRVDLNTIHVPFSLVTGADIFVNTFDGDDLFTVDYSLGDFSKAISYDGGLNGVAGDALALDGGGSFADAIFGFTDSTSGTVDLTGNGQLSYSGLEPITSTITAENVTLNYSDTAETITVSAAGSQTQVTSTSGETLIFDNPTTSLTINAGDVGDDSIIINGFGTGFDAAFTLNANTILLNTPTVTTTNDQTFNGKVLLGVADVTLSGNDITFQSTIDSTSGNNHALTINTSNDGVTTFNGVVGGTDRLSTLTTNADGSSIVGANINTTGDVFIGDALTLNADVIVDTDSGNLTFDDAIDGAHSLTLNSPGTTRFNGKIGETTRLTDLTTDAEGITELNAPSGGTANPSIRTTGAQNYLDTVTLVSNTALQGQSVLFDSTLDGQRSFIASVTQSLTFNGEVGGSTSLGALQINTNGTTFINGGLIRTNQIQSYLNNLTFDSATNTTTLESLTGGITFARNSGRNVRSATDGEESLIISASNFTLNAAMSDPAQRLNELTVNAPVTINNGGITTVGDQTFNGAVTLGADTTLDASAITFDSTVDGAFALDLQPTGAVTFGGAVGDSEALTSLTQTGARTFVDGGSITTVGAQTYQVSSGVILRADAILTSTNSETIRFNKSVHGDSNGAHSLTVNGNAFFNFNAGQTQGGIDRAFSSLTVNGTTNFNGNGTTTLTTGAQTYNGAVNLGLNRTLISENGEDITFVSTIDRSAVSAVLTVNTTGRTIFGGAIGATTPLRTLTTDLGGTTEINGGSITTINDQTFNDAVSIDEDTILAGDNVIFNDTVDLGTFTLTVDVSETDSEANDVISGSGNLIKEGTGNFSLNVDNTYTGTTTVTDGLLSTKSLDSSAIFVDDGATLESVDSLAGTVTVRGGGIFTPGPNQVTINTGDLTLEAGANLNLDVETNIQDLVQVTGTIDIDGANLNLSGSRVLSNNRSVTILENDGTDAIVGTFNGLAEGDKFVFNGRTLQISYVGGDGNDITLTERSLVVSLDNGDNEVKVDGEIGNEDSVRITTPSEGIIRIETLNPGDTISLGSGTRNGGFTLSDNDTVVTIDATQFTMDQLQVNLGDQDDTLDFDWTLTPTDLDRITLNGEDGTDVATITGTVVLPDRFNATFETINLDADIETSSTQTWTGDITLQGDSTLFGRAGGSVNLIGKVDGAHAFSVSAVGGGATVNFRDEVGSIDPLTTLFVRGRGTNFSGGSITTVGTQTFNGDFGNFLQDDMIFTSLNGELVSFQRPVLVQNNQIGQHSVTVNGDAQFSEGFGRTRNGVERPLESITINGTTTLPGRFANFTTGDQTYNGPVIATGEAEFISTVGGTITFASTLDRTGSVTISDIVIDTTGTVVFEDEVGGNNRLNTLVVNASNLEINGGLINTRRNMTFNSPIILGADLTLQGTRGARLNDKVDLQSFNLNLETLSFSATDVISGTGDVIARSAGGTFLADNTYTGQTILDSIFSAQTVNVEQSLADGVNAIDIVVNGRNVLNLLNGSSVGSVQVLSRGVLVLDGSFSRASTGSLILEQNSTYVAEVEGTAGAGVAGGHEQIDVFGTVTINNALLNPIMASNLPIGSSFIILNNDGSDAIVGNFSGFAEGSVFNRNGENFQITYQGGDGNDIEITRLVNPVYNFTTDNFDIQETDADFTSVTVTIERTGLTSVETALTVDLTDGTAIAGVDYVADPIRVIFAAGETIQTVEIPILGDDLDELDETLTLSMRQFNRNGEAGVDQPTTTVTLLDDDSTPVPDAGGPYVIDEGAPLTLDASASFDLDSTDLTFRWDIDGDGDFEEDITGVNPTVTSAQLADLGLNDGPFGPVTITVEVGDGTNIDTASTDLVIENVAPFLTVDQSFVRPTPGQPLQNGGTVSDPGQDTITLTTNIGTVQFDGPNRWLWTINPTVGQLGRQDVTITATDSDGATTEISFVAIVTRASVGLPSNAQNNAETFNSFSNGFGSNSRSIFSSPQESSPVIPFSNVDRVDTESLDAVFSNGRIGSLFDMYLEGGRVNEELPETMSEWWEWFKEILEDVSNTEEDSEQSNTANTTETPTSQAEQELKEEVEHERKEVVAQESSRGTP